MSNTGASCQSVCKPGPLSGKRFFIDPKVDRTTSDKVKQKLIALGGKVEEFLDKGINFALTSEAIVGRGGKDGKKRQSSQSPFNTTSPAVEQNSAMGTRWKNLAKQAGCKVQSASIVEVAKSFGIKIRLIDDVLTWLNKKTEALNTSGAGLNSPPHQPPDIRLKHPCLKIEDVKRSIKPIYEEFESFSHLDLSIKGRKCPFVNTHSPVKAKPNEKKRPEKKGFCECCQCSYLNEKKHRKTAEHQTFGETVSHFKHLDEYISSQNLSLGTFLSRYQSTSKHVKAPNDPPKDDDKKTLACDKDQANTSPSSSLKSPHCQSVEICLSAVGIHRRKSPREKNKPVEVKPPDSASQSSTRKLPPCQSVENCLTTVGTPRRRSPRKSQIDSEKNKSNEFKSPDSATCTQKLPPCQSVENCFPTVGTPRRRSPRKSQIDSEKTKSNEFKSPDSATFIQKLLPCQSMENCLPTVGTPRRRSPRKSVRADSPVLKRSSKTKESKRLNFDTDDRSKNSATLQQTDAEFSPFSKVSEQQILDSLKLNNDHGLEAMSKNLRFSPTVALRELPAEDLKRKRILSSDAALASQSHDTSSPLSRLRSFKRKALVFFEDIDSKRTRLLAESDTLPAGDLQSILKSSEGEASTEKEFLGF